MKNIWSKFYSCDCGAEGIMMSTEDISTDKNRQIYLAFFQNGWNGKELDIKRKIQWCWKIITTGLPYCDCVILNPDTANLLAKDLNKFAKGTLK